MEREVGGGIGMGNTCKPMAVSFQCMTKSTTNKKKKLKKFKKCLYLSLNTEMVIEFYYSIQGILCRKEKESVIGRYTRTVLIYIYTYICIYVYIKL